MRKYIYTSIDIFVYLPMQRSRKNIIVAADFEENVTDTTISTPLMA